MLDLFTGGSTSENQARNLAKAIERSTNVLKRNSRDVRKVFKKSGYDFEKQKFLNVSASMFSALIIDNIKENFERQEANGIEIKTWMSDPSDRELDNLMAFLKGMVQSQVLDVRPLVNLFKADCWKSPEKKKRMEDIEAGEEVNPRGCTPHSDKKGLEAKFVR